MTAKKLSRKMFRLSVSRRRFLWRFLILRRRLRSLWNRILALATGKSTRYRQLSCNGMSSPSPVGDVESGFDRGNDPSDLVALKISLLGDCQIGKTSFLKKYVGREKEQGGIQMAGLHQMDKTLSVRGARIAYSIWEVGGGETSQDHIPIACKDSVAILIIVIRWYQQARKWNQNAIPVLVGTKFDDFVRLPMDLQWTIASQVMIAAVVCKGKNNANGKSICKGPECTPFLLKRDVQHKREQDLQIHHGKALQPALDSGAKPDNRRTHHRFLDFASESHHVNISD
ncbi:hypothetical protein RHMOL_Rhmol06G0224400 [Rhododendron molle]|uniref:Uncharacterized protein n=1 Tax=Rhododendron molle TaxID=49168 RepID=A0ACC0NHF4_RHOML|nr:hypothetical protein RHMOL_Rhmol06G0224400 [Rhododendron molle]